MNNGLNKLQEHRNASGLKLYEDGHVYPYGKLFKIQSESDRDFYYEVDAEGAQCSCMDWKKMGRYLLCKHQKAVEYYIKNGPLLLTIY